ncbi:MAG: hypothetical protein AABX83_02510, partial [Nanoarchaeota archaeon]
MKRGLFIIFLVLALFPLASADIYINGVKEVYNVGDVVEAEVTLSSSVYTSGFFKSYLVCGANEIQTYLSQEAIGANEEKIITVRAVIDNNIIGDLIGECYLRSSYGSGEVRSQPFRISRGVRIDIDIDNIVFYPEEIVSISGKVTKDNGELLNGYISILVEGIDVKIPSPDQANQNNYDTETNETDINGTDVEEEVADEE